MDQPSAEFGSLGIADVTKVGESLDRKVVNLLRVIGVEAMRPFPEASTSSRWAIFANLRPTTRRSAGNYFGDGDPLRLSSGISTRDRTVSTPASYEPRWPRR